MLVLLDSPSVILSFYFKETEEMETERKRLQQEKKTKEKGKLEKKMEKIKEKQSKFVQQLENITQMDVQKLLFETDIRNGVVLEEKVYAYGSHIKETDYIHREIFVFLVAFLNLVIKPKKWYSIGDSTVKECVKEEVPLQENTTELNKDKI